MSERQVPSAERRYESYSHAAMRAEVEAGNDPAAAGEIGAEWADLAARMHDSAEWLRRLSDSSTELWQGSAGEALRSVLGRAVTWSDEAAGVSSTLGESVSQQAAISAKAKAEMPEPVEYDPGAVIRETALSGDIAGLIGLSDRLTALRAQSESARQKAIDVMNSRDAGLRAAVPAAGFGAPPALTSDAP
ncbi:PPE family protein [Amycolatopsis marina]|uniref:PPE family protein n=1 Tax=Amycolatopsis marina TaxID=490629 RepID=A0A1I1BDN6_9PSEU|nr:PPE domain-containing protein [Amycolatopsis marina]SFB46613.1 PPE family protein [Amycolatopsis marina]